jgi:hypothetical protein
MFYRISEKGLLFLSLNTRRNLPNAYIGVAIYKVIKSKLPDWEKVYWIIAFIVLNIVAAIPFIIFHDFFLSKEKRAGKR